MQIRFSFFHFFQMNSLKRKEVDFYNKCTQLPWILVRVEKAISLFFKKCDLVKRIASEK